MSVRSRPSERVDETRAARSTSDQYRPDGRGAGESEEGGGAGAAGFDDGAHTERTREIVAMTSSAERAGPAGSIFFYSSVDAWRAADGFRGRPSENGLRWDATAANLTTVRSMPTANAEGLDRIGGQRRKGLR